MIFKRVDESTVRCLITEDELHEQGLDMEDFLTNGQKTEGFLRKVITQAQQEVDYKTPNGALSIQANILPDHTLVITLSERNDQSLLGLLESLKDAVGKLAEQSEKTKNDQENQAALTKCREVYELEFLDLENLMQYTKAVTASVPIQSVLYKLDKTNCYYLVIKKGDLSEQEMCKLLGSAMDFSENIFSDVGLLAYLDEHGEKIIQEGAVQVLQGL